MNELGRVGRLIAFEPRVVRTLLGFTEAFQQTPLCFVDRVDGFLAHFLYAETLDEVVAAFEVVGVLAVVLEEKLGGLDGFGRGFDSDQQISLAYALAGRSADNNLPGPFLPDKTDVFDGRLGAVARTTEKVPSFWMLAWTRSLMKRAERSSS